MHSGIVNGYQLLWDAHTVLEIHRVAAALFLFYSFCPFFTYICVFGTLDNAFSALGCLNS